MPHSIYGLNGEIRRVETAVPAAAAAPDLKNAQAHRRNDIDLKRMAEWALHYLIETPRKELDYEPVFQCSPLDCPPIPQGTDVVVACDTDARMDWEWYYMREITGSDRGRDVEEAFHRRIRNYIDPDGKVWAHVGCYNENLTEVRYGAEDNVIHVWGATKILHSLSVDYARTNNPESSALARKVMSALRRLAVWESADCCYFPAGMGALKPDLTVVPNFWNKHPAPVVEPLVTYWQSTGDPEGLQFAIAYAEGMIRNAQPDGIVFRGDGSVDYGPGNPHSHATMHAVWGVAHLGSVLHEPRYVGFAKRVWDWMNKRGTGTGWFPAMPDNCNETCLLSDMISIACLIGRNGYPEYYDYAERFMRNYVHNLQFIMTPAFEQYYRKLHADTDEQAVRASLEELRKFQGGVIGGSGLNDYENDLLGGVSGFKMYGCCAPEGMRAIHTVWSNTLEKRAQATDRDPAGVYVNLGFGRESELADVISFLPDEGKLAVQVKQAGPFFLRVPHWAPKNEVRAFVNGKETRPQWSGSYVRFDAAAGDELAAAYPLLRFTQEVAGLWSHEANRPDLVMTFQWEGNMVVASDPPAARTALYTGAPRQLPACHAH